MKKKEVLSRREREIMDILYREGELTAGELVARLHDEPSNSTVRTLLRILEEKGHVKHQQEGTRYVYKPTVAREKARRSALNHLLSTFFDDSPEAVVSTLLDERSRKLSNEQLETLAQLIERARKEGR
ncbi:MAG: BlaI/MecI/CopY family transcriptional regulator [Acidobacteriota bacterium]|nr:BlaI/MecI/CopY family transcriptional regulator [Acidobacteriota bacterium]